LSSAVGREIVEAADLLLALEETDSKLPPIGWQHFGRQENLPEHGQRGHKV
jgi:hypothetical protein